MAYILISTLDSKFILDLYHIIHSSVQVNYLYFHQFDVLNGATGPGLGYVVFEICSFLKYSRRGPDLSYCLYLFNYLFIYLSWECTFLVMLIVALTRSIPSVP